MTRQNPGQNPRLTDIFHDLSDRKVNTIYIVALLLVGGDRGAGDREKRGREVYGRREKRGREAGFPRWREAGEKGENYATLRNIAGGNRDYRVREAGGSNPPVPPPPTRLPCSKAIQKFIEFGYPILNMQEYTTLTC